MPDQLPFIMVAPTGARRSKQDHPALPISTDEIIATACACQTAGADALHLHIRDAQGNHSLDPGKYRETLDELARKVPQLVIQVTTESAGIFDVDAQFACLRDLQPNWASVSVRETTREPDLAKRLYRLCADQGTRLQHILYDLADLELLKSWREAGHVVPSQNETILVLGRYGKGGPSNASDLDSLVAALPSDLKWMVCAFGSSEHACLQHAASLGGSCRVGFENSLRNKEGKFWTDNAQSVRTLLQSLKADTL